MTKTKMITAEEATKKMLDGNTQVGVVDELVSKFKNNLDFAKALASRNNNTSSNAFKELYEFWRPDISKTNPEIFREKGGANVVRKIMARNIDQMPEYVADNLRNDPEYSIRMAAKEAVKIKR